jgi:fatty-acid desaturase
MMKPVFRIDGQAACPVKGKPVLSPFKIFWHGSLLLLCLVFVPQTFSWSAFAVFAVLTYLFLLVGHSVAMHRMMIHRSFDCPLWLERLLIYTGVLVGLSGPSGIIRIHDLRDWAQRQPACHDFFAHRRGYVQDIIWQLFYVFKFDHPPRFMIEEKYSKDRWYHFMDKTWPLHQIVVALPLYLIGGWSFVVYGVFLRVLVSILGHWTITYVCHNPGHGHWHVKGAAVQASNMNRMGFMTFGECWHNNHHAFPESARIGLEKGQFDPGWLVIQGLNRCGLISRLGLPRPDHERDDLTRIYPNT